MADVVHCPNCGVSRESCARSALPGHGRLCYVCCPCLLEDRPGEDAPGAPEPEGLPAPEAPDDPPGEDVEPDPAPDAEDAC